MNTITNTTSKAILKLSLVIAFFLFSNTTVFAQEKVSEVVSIPAATSLNETKVVLDSQVDFMNWFMSSKQSQFSDENTDVSGNAATARKKHFINSGVTPNKVLYRTFVKKVTSQDSALV